MNNLKTRIRNGEAVNGCWLNLGSAITAEMVAQSGFDWVLIDLEHGLGSEKDAVNQLQALKGSNTSGIVRVEAGNAERIHRILDIGANGVMCPRITSVKEAQVVVSALRYPPGGTRGVAKMVRATNYGRDSTEYMKEADNTILGVIQIETKEVLDDLDAIANLEGVDVLFIGPSDLSLSLGIFGQLDHPVFKDAVKATINAAQKAGKATGILLYSPEDYQRYYDQGVRFLACGADGTFVTEGARAMSSALGGMRNRLVNKA